tara:strand:+ start:37 stop:402 length:366 start_codon:yes stop_codon:yes gene_type:complete
MSNLGNPQNYYNGFISLSRNVFLTSSVGIAMHGYSNSFKTSTSSILVMVAAKLIFVFAFLYGLFGVIGMLRYMKQIENSNEPLSKQVQLNLWRRQVYLVCFYLAIIFVLFILKLKRFMSIF